MTATYDQAHRTPRVPRVRVDKRPGFWRWTCLDRTPGVHVDSGRSAGCFWWSQADALADGLAHLAEHHAPTASGYSRRCGVHTDDCIADTCECADGAQTAAQSPEALRDPDGPKVAQILAMRPHSGDYGPLHRSHNEGIRR